MSPLLPARGFYRHQRENQIGVCLQLGNGKWLSASTDIGSQVHEAKVVSLSFLAVLAGK